MFSLGCCWYFIDKRHCVHSRKPGSWQVFRYFAAAKWMGLKIRRCGPYTPPCVCAPSLSASSLTISIVCKVRARWLRLADSAR